MHFRFVRPGAVVFLVAVWLLLWGSVTVANVLSGLVIAVVLLAALPMRPGARRHVYFRPLPFLALSWYFVRKLIEANVVLTREVVTSGDGVTTAIIAVPVRGCSDFVITSIANVTALTPGTMVVEMTTIPPVLYLHVLHAENEAKIRADVARLNSITVHAFGSPFDIESLELPDPIVVDDPEEQP